MSLTLSVKEVKVGINFGDGVIPVGRLAMGNRKIYFEYDRDFISRKLEISPLRLPLKAGVFSFECFLFEGLPGVLNDSLADGWGRLLFDRFALSKGVMASEITALDRLAYVGQNGMGALVYEPDYSIVTTDDPICLDKMAEETRMILEGLSNDVLEKILVLNGSSAGARPKALIGINEKRDHLIYGTHDLPPGYTPWIVKFVMSKERLDAGAIEYVYALMAKEADIIVPNVHLFDSQKCPGYFAVQRFDRQGHKRYHMHTACGLLHSDYRAPSLDYRDLLVLTGALTQDVREVEKMYRLAVFNVLAHNRDDHSKNFSFLMDKDGQWKVSPAYDLTFSSGPYGEQSTLVAGEGRNPTIEHLIKLGLFGSLKKDRIHEIIDQTRESLSKWTNLAKANGVDAMSIKAIEGKINRFQK